MSDTLHRPVRDAEDRARPDAEAARAKIRAVALRHGWRAPAWIQGGERRLCEVEQACDLARLSRVIASAPVDYRPRFWNRPWDQDQAAEQARATQRALAGHTPPDEDR